MKLFVLPLFLLGVLSAGLAHADVIFTLSPVAGTSYNLGDSVTIQLIATDTNNSHIGANWLGFNAQITATTGDGNDAPVQALGPKFNPPPFAPPGLTAAFDGVGPPAGRTFTGLGNNTAFVNGDVVASFTYTASVAGPTTFNFNTSVPGFNSADFAIGAVTTATGLSVVGTTVNVVPEPSSLALLGLFGAGVLGYRRRR